MPEDEFDARMARYLRWESEQVGGAPGSDEIAIELVTGASPRRWAGNPALVWAVLVMALLAVVATAIFVGNQNPNLVVVSPDPSVQTSPTATSTPLQTPTRPPITGAGPCRDGRVDIQPMPDFAVRPEVDLIVAPQGGRIAMALEDNAESGTIVIADPVRGDLRVVATFTGDELDWEGRVQVLSWSPDGQSLLVLALSSSNGDAARNCGNLFVVQADGSAVRSVTDLGPGQVAGGGAFSPSGASVAYTLDGMLHVETLAGGSIAVPVICSFIFGELHWSADEQRILVMCGAQLLVVDLDAGTRRYGAVGPGPLDARWTSNDQAIVVAVGDEAPGLVGGPLTILDVDPVDMSIATRVRSDASTEWVLGRPSLSPDNRWLLVQGDGNVSDIPYYPTYLVDTATGATTKLPWPVMSDWSNRGDIFGRLPLVTWLAGNDKVLTADQGTLYEVDLRSIMRTAVGSVPAADFAWTSTR
jgi:hypothetical protein